MGKDHELLQAVKTEDLMTVQKLLQRPKPGKAMWQQHTPALLNTAPCNDGVNEHEVHPHHCTFTIGERGMSCQRASSLGFLPSKQHTSCRSPDHTFPEGAIEARHLSLPRTPSVEEMDIFSPL
ncbi:hypothetical protein PO909_001448 [Leuciscus waleckii]